MEYEPVKTNSSDAHIRHEHSMALALSTQMWVATPESLMKALTPLVLPTERCLPGCNPIFQCEKEAVPPALTPYSSCQPSGLQWD